ncbi:MAG: hypothetical protein A3E01_00305 [Gammaproteobacteria bacterium RIFCSPHIGHO2_12_FULL_63_22]|nr:MAG: hypothetical protein A3E01_00305 [Gammaproteobacteria bacterium RIFCSPHIGHO2_12_FULL_63_22]
MIRILLLLCTLAHPVTRTHQELIDLVGRKGDVTHLYDLYRAGDSARARIDTLYNRIDWVTPQDYGALGDGSTNDSAAFAAMVLATNSAGGGHIYFPTGTYLTSYRMIFTTGNLHLRGEKGAVLRRIQNDQYKNGLIYVRPTESPTGADSVENLVIENLQIDMSEASVDSSSEFAHALSLVQVHNFRISDNVITNTDGEAIYTQHCRHGEISNNRIFNAGNQYGRMGISVVGGRQIEIHGNWVDSSTAGVDAEPDNSNGGTAYPGLMDVVDIHIHGNTFRRVQSGVTLYNHSTAADAGFRNISIIGNHIYHRSNSFPAIYAKRRGVGDFYGIVVQGNTIEAEQYTGIQINGADRSVVANNTIKYTGVGTSIYNGFEISYCDGLSISGNEVAGYTRGFSVAGDSARNNQNITLSGNIIKDCGTAIRFLQDYQYRIILSGTIIQNCTQGIAINGGMSANSHFSIMGNVANLTASSGNFLDVTTLLDTASIIGNVSNGVIQFNTSGGSNTLRNARFAGNSVSAITSNFSAHGDNDIDWVGVGSPEGVIVAAIGATFRRSDGGASTTLYIKESGTGNTGWVAK